MVWFACVFCSFLSTYLLYNMSILYNNRPVGYGALVYSGQSTYPFFTSQPDISALSGVNSIGSSTTINVADFDDFWIVMPGYKAIVYYDANFSGTTSTYDNTLGTSVMANNNAAAAYDKASSLQLYYKGILIPFPG